MPAHPTATTPKHVRAAKSHASIASNLPLNGKQSSNQNDQSLSDYEFDLSAPTEVHRTPADQLTHLTEEQKNEVFTKTITAADPNVKKGLARFDYTEGTFKPVSSVSHLVVHFSMDSSLIHTESEEAREQVHWMDQNSNRMLVFKSAGTDTSTDPMSPPMSPAPRTAEMETSTDGNDRALKNQFNYSERGNQTINPMYRDREVGTEPPPCVEFGGQVTHWEIFDTYAAQLEKEVTQRAAQDKPKKKQHDDDDDEENEQPNIQPFDQSINQSNTADAQSALFDSILHSESCALALKTMERLINQNSEAASFHDYKYNDEPLPTQHHSNNQSANPLSLSNNQSANQSVKGQNQR